MADKTVQSKSVYLMASWLQPVHAQWAQKDGIWRTEWDLGEVEAVCKSEGQPSSVNPERQIWEGRIMAEA